MHDDDNVLDDFDDERSRHALVLLQQTKDFVEWKCPTCGRHVRVAFAGGLDILQPGDRNARHRAGVGVGLDSAWVNTPDHVPPSTIH